MDDDDAKCLVTRPRQTISHAPTIMHIDFNDTLLRSVTIMINDDKFCSDNIVMLPYRAGLILSYRAMQGCIQPLVKI